MIGKIVQIAYNNKFQAKIINDKEVVIIHNLFETKINIETKEILFDLVYYDLTELLCIKEIIEALNED